MDDTFSSIFFNSCLPNQTLPDETGLVGSYKFYIQTKAVLFKYHAVIGSIGCAINGVAFGVLYKLHKKGDITWRHIYLSLASLFLDTVACLLMLIAAVANLQIGPLGLKLSWVNVLDMVVYLAMLYIPMIGYFFNGLLQLLAVRYPLVYMKYMTYGVSKLLTAAYFTAVTVTILASLYLVSQVAGDQGIQMLKLMQTLEHWNKILMTTLGVDIAFLIAVQISIGVVLRTRIQHTTSHCSSHRRNAKSVRLRIWLQLLLASIMLFLQGYIVYRLEAILGLCQSSASACTQPIYDSVQEAFNLCSALFCGYALWSVRAVSDPVVYFCSLRNEIAHARARRPSSSRSRSSFADRKRSPFLPRGAHQKARCEEGCAKKHNIDTVVSIENGGRRQTPSTRLPAAETETTL